MSGESLHMKRIFIAVVVAYALPSAGCGSAAPASSQNGGGAGDEGQIARAFENKTSDVQVEGEGVVTQILSDDLSGSRHQRFIVSLASGQTILIVHNIDLAERVDGLQTGDRVGFYGEYMWNEQGGKVHWTHHDPQGRHVAGWLKYNGRTYQ